MNRIDRKKLETELRNAFLSQTPPLLASDWQAKVMDDIKRQPKAEVKETGWDFSPRFAWRYAVASVAIAAIICLVLYIMFPAADSTTITTEQLNNLSYDSFDSCVKIVARL
jgi:uncharacterized membrane protein YdfJ with MMPL/SSD domain